MRSIFIRFFQKVACFIFILWPFFSSAAEWSLESGMKVKALYNDNIHLATTANDEKGITGGSFNPSLIFKMDDEIQNFKAALDIDLTRYNNEPDLRRNEGALDLSWVKKSQRGQFSLSSSYSIESSLDHNLDISGITDQEVTRNTASISPSWTYSLSEKNMLLLQYSFTDTRYDEPGSSVSGYENIKIVNFADYQQQTYTGMLKHLFTESDNVSFTVSLTDYDGEGNGLLFGGYGPFEAYFVATEQFTEYRNVAYQIGYSHSFTETQKLEFSVGTNKTETERLTRQHNIVFVPPSDNPLSWITSESERRGNKYNFSYEYNAENENISFVIGQDFVSESTGFLVDQQRAIFDYSLKNSERLTLGLKLSASNDETVVEASGDTLADRKRAVMSPFLRWRLAKDWSLTVRYSYSYLSRDTDVTNAYSNGIYLRVDWDWPKMISTY